MGYWLILSVMLWSTLVEASDIVTCQGTAYLGFEKSVSTQEAWLTDPTRIVNPSDRRFLTIPDRYRKCVIDQDGKAIGVEEMSQAEKDILDAPAKALAARHATLQDALASPSCSGTPEQLRDSILATTNAMPELRDRLAALAYCVAARKELNGER